MVKSLPADNIDEHYGISLFAQTIQKPFKYIVDNSGRSSAFLKNELLSRNDPFCVYDVRSGEFGHFLEKGIMDSTFNIKSIMKDAFSVSQLLLNNAYTITQEKVYVPSSMKEYRHLGLL